MRLFDTGHNRKTDAHAVAVVAVRTANLRVLKVDGELEAMRMLTDRREALTRRRVQTVCRLQALLAELLPGRAKRDITALQAKKMLSSVRPRDIAGKTRRRIAAEELADLIAVEDKINRLGEAAAVQLGDLNFLHKTLSVGRQVQRVNGGTIDVRAPKYGSERVVYLADSLVDLLARHIATFGTHGESQWLFVGDGEDPPHQNTVGYWWRKTLRDAGLSGIKLHDLRHFYASGLIAAGCDVVTVQRSLGHSKATMTLNTYAHLWPTAEDRTRKAAESIMAASIGGLLTEEFPAGG